MSTHRTPRLPRRPLRRPLRRPVVVATAVLGLVASPLAVGLVTPASADPAGTGLVISEVYGGGGNAGATLRSDFIELYNPTSAAISLGGLSLQYRSSGGTPGGDPLALSGSVAPGDHFLVKAADGSGGTQDLPTPDATSTFAMSGTNGQVLLVDGTTAFTGSEDVAGDAGLVDAVGYGSATTFEGAAAPVLSNTTAATRTADGTDTDANAADFSAAAPDPQNSTSEDTDPPTDPPTDPQQATIAQIQGTGAASPLVGDTVVTQGVVTASYPTGGFGGFYLQTAGTGGASDATPGASDGVFVAAPSVPAAGYPEVGDDLQVTGAVSEAFTTTTVTAAAADIEPAPTALAEVTPLAAAYPRTETAREAHESELLAPTDTFTVTNTFGTNQYGEIGLATGDRPLIQPTDVRDFQNGNPGEVTADNAARGVVLDDGSSTNYLTTGQDTPLPWLTPTNAVRVGARATLGAPVVLKYDFGVWRFQPQEQVTDAGTDAATFADTRAADQAPADVGGDIRLATFNVLNYFPTTGAEYVAAGNTCSYFNDRAGNPVTNETCSNNGPRGAADQADLERQQAKIVAAVNGLGAGIVSLEEIENSVKLGKDRDFAVSRLVEALNAAAGAGTWDYVRSPGVADLPTPAQEDVIRTAFIYKPALVSPVGASEVLIDEDNFDNAREPLAQAFKAVGATDEQAFGVVVNHFKSKGGAPTSGANADTGQGGFNADRVGQAQALSAFADSFADDRGIDALFLTGDFNSYTQEDPLQELYAGGYTNLESDTAGESTYSFGGLSGSLDHVLANKAAQALVTGVDIWNINSPESVAYEYSRYNYNATDLYAPNQFRASDHDPEVVGLDLAKVGVPVPVELNLLNINDFHGRIDADTTKFATTIEQLRAQGGEDDTLFLSAGDNIGASLFASSVQQDQPTIDVLDALGLRTSSVGNHEFDRGFTDLRDRVEPAADWSYLGANVYRAGTQTPVLDPYDLFEVDGLTVAVVGAVTQETPSLVSPGGIEGLEFGDPVDAVNRVADRLTDGISTRNNDEADVIVAEYHEGAGAGVADGATLQQEIAEGGAFAKIATQTSAAVDVIFTGHTHKEYAFDGPVPGSPDRTRPILQTGSYGANIGQVQLTLDPGTGDVTAYTQRNVPRVAAEDLTFPRVAQVKQITDAALANAASIGNQPVGRIGADITTAYSGGARDDRAAESTLGDTVANALRDGVSDFAEPDLGITNPGGLRADLRFARDTANAQETTDGVVTFAEANAVLPFNNTVALVDLTGAELEDVLEQQWQTAADGTTPSRPYLQLALSDNVEVTADPTNPAGQRITSVRLDGAPLDPAATYTVSTLSFLAQGGDNFRAFTGGTYVDTGLIDADLWRDYLATGTAEAPIQPDFARQQVFSTDLPASLPAGETSSFTLGVAPGSGGAPLTGTTLDLTSLGSPANTTVEATLLPDAQATDGADLGAFPVSSGLADVSVAVPAGTPGTAVVQLVAQPSGTTVTVPVSAGGQTPPPDGPPTQAASRTTLTLSPQRARTDQRVVMTARVATGGRPATGFVKFTVAGKGAFSRRLEDGRARLGFIRYVQPGKKAVTVVYNGNATTAASRDSATLRVRR